MRKHSSRRNFLVAGLGLPAVGMAATSAPLSAPSANAPLSLPAGDVKLSYRTLGNTGLKVTSLGFGCMITSDASVIERAAGDGITYFDTARSYQSGNNERMVGAALKSKRNDIVLSSKSHAATKQEALDELDTSLKELGTDHLDVWYLHNKSRPEQVPDELIEAQQEAKKAGKIRFAGVSTHAGEVMIPFCVKNGNVDVVLTTYNFSMAPGLDEAIQAGRAAGMGIVAMKVMAGGFRSNKPGTELHSTLQRDGAMLAALKWVLRNKSVDTCIPSMTDMGQLDENLQAMSSSFNENDKKLLAAQLAYIRPLYCRMCGSCEGTCAKGLPVSDVVRYLTYADGYGQFTLGREYFLNLPAELKKIRCSDCESCTVSCPNGVRVTERLSRAQEVFA